MRKISVIAVFCGFFLLQSLAQAQQADVGIGFGTLLAPSASSADSNHFPQSIRGGLYTSVRADVFMKHHFGFNGEVAWRTRQNLFNVGGFGEIPFRPILYDFNGVFGERFSKAFGADVMAGIGGEDIRFYGSINCSFTGCTNYTSSTHFLGHFGADARLYVHGNVFLRPEAHFYFIRNNNEFSSDHVTRLGISIGYSFFSNK